MQVTPRFTKQLMCYFRINLDGTDQVFTLTKNPHKVQTLLELVGYTEDPRNDIPEAGHTLNVLAVLTLHWQSPERALLRLFFDAYLELSFELKCIHVYYSALLERATLLRLHVKRALEFAVSNKTPFTAPTHDPKPKPLPR